MTPRAGRGKPSSMSFVSLDRLVKGGQVRVEDAGRVEFLWDEIRRLKREKNAFIPAHNYQVPEVQAIADTVGDSFELAVRARDIDADLVIFCGVRFMAEGCHTLAPQRPVYLPSLDALCSLAEVDADDVAERQEFLRSLGRRFATMTYVNTYADVKALSDACCTSSNAPRIADAAGRARHPVRARPEPGLPGRAQDQAHVPAAARSASVPPQASTARWSSR